MLQILMNPNIARCVAMAMIVIGHEAGRRCRRHAEARPAPVPVPLPAPAPVQAVRSEPQPEGGCLPMPGGPRPECARCPGRTVHITVQEGGMVNVNDIHDNGQVISLPERKEVET